MTRVKGELFGRNNRHMKERTVGQGPRECLKSQTNLKLIEGISGGRLAPLQLEDWSRNSLGERK